jgi:large subunit ribosomal protein L13
LAVENLESETLIVVNAANQVVGRMASRVAKLLLEGRRVVVVNAEKTLISGSRTSIVQKQLIRLERGSIVNPENNPHRFKEPHRMLQRIVRGMLPRKKPRGQAALKRLRVYIGTPLQYQSMAQKVFEDAKARKPLPMYTTMAELAMTLGWRHRSA